MQEPAKASQKEITEHFDKPEDLQTKIKQLADLIKNARHLLIFTGEGISQTENKGIFTDRYALLKNEIKTNPTITHGTKNID